MIDTNNPNNPNNPNEPQDISTGDSDGDLIKLQGKDDSKSQLDAMFNTGVSGGSSPSSKENLIKEAFTSPYWDGPNSYEEGVEIVKKYAGKTWDEIPPEDRICYVLLNVVARGGKNVSGTTGIGYNPNTRNPERVNVPGGSNLTLIRTAIEWGGIFIRTPDPDTGVLRMLRLDDSKPLPITCSMFLPPTTIHLIEQMMDERRTQSIFLGCLASAEGGITTLDLPSKRDQVAILRREAAARGEKLEINEEAFQSKAVTLNNVFIDHTTIRSAPMINLTETYQDPTSLVIAMNRSTVAGSTAARSIRQMIIQQEQVTAPQSFPNPLDQMDAVDRTPELNL